MVIQRDINLILHVLYVVCLRYYNYVYGGKLNVKPEHWLNLIDTDNCKICKNHKKNCLL